ncbi:MAG TPA: hypothetical protein VGO33_03410 [Gemmatimonadaceae bacterium]|jgi:hypothetical protein|nr:hypothetical protein [Gemmatimonadaceae bacterium]
MRSYFVITSIAVVVSVTACGNVLDVPNNNNPNVSQVLARPADVEAIIGSAYNVNHKATVGVNTDGIVQQMMVMSFENGSALANYGFNRRYPIPRSFIDNSKNNSVAAGNYYDFANDAKGARSASTGLEQLNKPAFSLGSADQDNRARAFAYFNMGVGNGNLALVYDSGAVVTEFNVHDIPPLVGHDSLMRAALNQLDSAFVYSQKTTMPLGATWINGNPMTPTVFGQFIKSYKARFRAGVARTPTERAAVNWNAVLADALAGIQANVVVSLAPSSGWDIGWIIQHYLFDTWHQQPPMIIGMADSAHTDGTFDYDAWLATPLGGRTRFLIKTADQRFPSGETRAAQQAASGTGANPVPPRATLYFRNGLADATADAYQLSQYEHYRFQALYTNGRVGNFTLMPKAEIDLLAAEAYFRLGDFTNAAAKINISRVGIGGLPPVVGAGTVPGGNACVPRVPDPAQNFQKAKCGDLFEALKWEKRLETAYIVYGAWYFDSRGWGDLAEGTALEWPVPYQELDTRVRPYYNLGGIGGKSAAATKGTYGY